MHSTRPLCNTFYYKENTSSPPALACQQQTHPPAQQGHTQRENTNKAPQAMTASMFQGFPVRLSICPNNLRLLITNYTPHKLCTIGIQKCIHRSHETITTPTDGHYCMPHSTPGKRLPSLSSTATIPGHKQPRVLMCCSGTQSESLMCRVGTITRQVDRGECSVEDLGSFQSHYRGIPREDSSTSQRHLGTPNAILVLGFLTGYRVPAPLRSLFLKSNLRRESAYMQYFFV